MLLGNVDEQGVFPPCSGLGTPRGAARHHCHASGAHEQLSGSRACRVSGSQRRMGSRLNSALLPLCWVFTDSCVVAITWPVRQMGNGKLVH